MPWKRRRLLISDFQYRLLAGAFTYQVLVVLVFLGSIYAPFVMAVFDDTVAGQAGEDAARQLLSLHSKIWMVVPVVLAGCALHSSLISHRVAGPLYRFRIIFRAISRGDLTKRVKIRDSDYLTEEADEFNGMILGLSERFRDIHRAHATVSRSLPEISRELRTIENPEVAVLLGKLESQIEHLGTCVRRLKVDEPTAADEAEVAAVDTTRSELSVPVAHDVPFDRQEADGVDPRRP
ncbi:MAG: methyl-accepting chemotaxis protein [bacterium]|nr:methyl-accepting chemotaxis protein [bacterium]